MKQISFTSKIQTSISNRNEWMEVYFIVKEILHSNLLVMDSAVHYKRFRKNSMYMFSASTIGEDSRKEVIFLRGTTISVYDLNTFAVVRTNPM